MKITSIILASIFCTSRSFSQDASPAAGETPSISPATERTPALAGREAMKSQPPEPVLSESVTANGLTKLHIASTEGKEIATYDVDLRNHHQPATETSENIRR